MKARRLILTGLAVALLAGAGIGVRQLRKAKTAAGLPTAPVRKGEFAAVVNCRATIGARRSVQLSAPRNVPDLKILWLAPQGGRVKTGEVVVKFDPTGANRQLGEQNAALLQAQASLDQAVAQARTASEQDRLDLANARYEVERARLEASKQAIVAVLQGEASKIDLATAEAKLRVQEAAAELHRKSEESRTASLRQQRNKAQADVDLTRSRIAQMNLASPLDGVISYQMNYSQGWMNAQPFKVGDQVWPGAIVAEIPDTTTLQMEGKVEEIDRGKVAVGNDVRIRVDAFPEQVFQGKLASISPLTEMSYEWPPVRSFMGYAPVENPDPRLRTGMNGRLEVVIRRIPNALSVPSKAVFMNNGKPVVYVAGEKGYRMLPVEVVARNQDEVAIEGVGAGASVALAEPDLTGEGTNR